MLGTALQEALPQALLVGDEELDDVRRLLGDLGVEFVNRGRLGPADPAPAPTHLLVISVELALELGYQRPADGGCERPLWIAIAQHESRTQRSLLLRKGFDRVVGRSAHPSCLRTLVRKAVYAGDRTQRQPRFAAGCPVTYRAGLRRRSGVLVDLSRSGCRILTPHPLELGTELVLKIHGVAGSPSNLSLSGSVVRIDPGEGDGGTPGSVSLAIRFGYQREDARRGLRRALAALVSGPVAVRAESGFRPRLAPQLPDQGPRPSPRSPRGIYERKVVVLGHPTGSLRALDLSPGGMRVERQRCLELGDRMRVVVEGATRTEPILVDAVVARDDGKRGMALRFQPREQTTAACLRAIVASLAPIAGEDGTGAAARLARATASIRERVCTLAQSSSS